jgi:hypothetical protein
MFTFRDLELPDSLFEDIVPSHQGVVEPNENQPVINNINFPDLAVVGYGVVDGAPARVGPPTGVIPPREDFLNVVDQLQTQIHNIQASLDQLVGILHRWNN